MSLTFKNFLKTLGPGIVFSGMCIGVSHLVQSTRAGADYGFDLLWVVLAANLFKYPFFEFSSRYTGATGVSILHGYAKMGKWILWGYGIMTICTMFIVTAAVTFVGAGLISNIFSSGLSANWWAAIILIGSAVILFSGKYGALDSLLKIVSVVLLLSTILAVVMALRKGRAPVGDDFVPVDILQGQGLIFLVALMGWMPTAIDLSIWTGLWAEARTDQTNYKPTLKETLLDFNIGYIMTAVLAVIFLTLGAMVMYGKGIELSNSSSVFAGQLIGLYTASIGEWSYFIIAVAAFSTMFSTSITVLDGYSRVMDRIILLLLGKAKNTYFIWVCSLVVGGVVVISLFLNNLKALVDMATVISFVIGPVAALLNHKAIFSDDLTSDQRPPVWMKWLSYAGLVFLLVFTLVFCDVYFGFHFMF